MIPGTNGYPIRTGSYGLWAWTAAAHGWGRYTENVIEVVNVQQVEIRSLEITNHGNRADVRCGILIEARDIGTEHHVLVGDLYIHDVNLPSAAN